jgi:hypothetical protein
MLDGLELKLVQEISTFDRRMLAEFKPPGREGSVLQNLGRRPTRIVLWGVAAEDGALQFVQDLDAKFKQAKPLPFSADIVADAELKEVVIDDLRWQELAGRPDRFAYVLTLREHNEPADPETAAPIDAELELEAELNIANLVNGLDAGLAFAEGLSRFIPALTDLANRLSQPNP